MRRLIALFIVTGQALLTSTVAAQEAPPPTTAPPPPPISAGDREDDIQIRHDDQGGSDGSTSGSGSGGTTTQVALDYHSAPGQTAEGAPCIGTIGVPPGTPNTPVNAGVVAALAATNTGQCPPAPGGPALPDPASYARSYAATVPLPVPDPYIAPGEMLVGWKAYMETGVDLSVDFADTTPFGPITIEAEGQVTIDWDDGDPPAGPYPNPGGPWPDGQLWNIYTYDGSYDITVTITWTANWAFLGQTGTITDGLATDATLADFPVYEAQAVIGS